MRKWLFMMLAGYIWKKVIAKGAANSPAGAGATARSAGLPRRGPDAAIR